jgi:hypothetical protein
MALPCRRSPASNERNISEIIQPYAAFIFVNFFRPCGAAAALAELYLGVVSRGALPTVRGALRGGQTALNLCGTISDFGASWIYTGMRSRLKIIVSLRFDAYGIFDRIDDWGGAGGALCWASL